MRLAVELVGIVNLVLFAAIAVVCVRQWNRERETTALWAALAFVAGACSGGGGGETAGLDGEFRPTPGERDVQITGAAKLKMGATLAVPVDAELPGGARAALRYELRAVHRERWLIAALEPHTA